MSPGTCCAECGNSAADGYALYCVRCVENVPTPELERVGEVPAPKSEWVGLTFDDIPTHRFGDINFLAGARWASETLRKRNT